MLDATKKQGITIGLISKQILFDQESLIGKSTAQIVCLEYSGKTIFLRISDDQRYKLY